MKRKKNLYLRRRMLAIFLAAIMCFGEFGVTALAEESSETPETTVENSSNTENVEDTDNTEDAEDADNTEDTDDTEDVEDADNTEDVENTENTEDVENTENVENTNNTEDVENADNVNNVENVSDTENAENADNVNNVENVDNTNNVENADQQTGYATREELEAAYNAVAGLIDSEDKSALNDAIDNYVSVYNRLSPEDQADTKEQYDYVVSLHPADTDSESEIEEDDTYSAPEELKETAVSDASVLRAAAPAASTVQKAARASRATYKGTVTLYGTPNAAIKAGPTYGSKVKIDLGTRTGQSWNNVSYRIPQVGEYFMLNDGWTIDYVSVAGNSSGKRQPGASFLLGMSGGSMVYYFKQTAVSKTFTLKYDANGGSGAPNTQTQKSTATSHDFTISSKKPTRTGYTFLGWSTDKTATSASYQGGGKINVKGTTTLYAVWKKNEEKTFIFTLNYNANKPSGASGDVGNMPDPQSSGAITAASWSPKVSNKVPTLDGHTFDGWYLNAEGTGKKYAAGDTVTGYSTTTTSQTLYAKWVPDDTSTPTSYKVEWYDTEGNPLKDMETREGTVGETVEPTDADCSIDGYTFDADNEGNILYSELVEVPGENQNVLRLYFTKNQDPPSPTITVTWLDGYTDKYIQRAENISKPESSPTTKEGVEALGVSYPNDPTREGYYFTKWGYPETDENGNITITAQWKKLTYEVEWYVVGKDEPFKKDTRDGGAVGQSVAVTEADKTCEGYTYTGDDYNKGGIKNILSAKLAKEGTVLKLYFTENSLKPNEANYTVEWYIVGTDDLVKTETRKGTIGEKVEVTDADKSYDGYDFVENHLGNITFIEKLGEDGGVLKLYFDRKAVDYTVVHEYYTNGSPNPPGSIQISNSGKVGEIVNAADIGKISRYGGNDYTYGSASAESITLTEGGQNTITLRYYRTTSDRRDPEPTPTPPRRNPDPTTEPDPDPSTDPAPNPTAAPSPIPSLVPGVPTVDILGTNVPLTNLPDEGVPMAKTPVKAEGLEVDIFDEEVPLSDVPKTGDISDLWYLAALLSAGMLAFLGLRRKNHK